KVSDDRAGGGRESVTTVGQVTSLPGRATCAKLTGDDVPFMRSPERASRLPCLKGEHLHDLLRNQASGRDQLPGDVRSPDNGERAPSCCRQEATGTRCRRATPLDQPSQRAPVSTVLPCSFRDRAAQTRRFQPF